MGKMVSVSQHEYGDYMERVRELFADGKPHLPKEANEVSEYGYVQIKRLFYQGFLLRTRDPLNYSYVETHGKKAKWRRIRGYMYIRADSPLLDENNTLEWEFKRTERWTWVTTSEKRLLHFINYEQSEELQKDHYKRLLSKKRVINYFKDRGMGATTGVIAKDLGVDTVRMSGFLRVMVAQGEVVKKGKWNPMLGRETMFRGHLHGYVYGLTPEQCESFIKSGKTLTAEANAILKETIKNSNDKRLTPLHIFVNSPYDYDPATVTYSVNNLVNLFKNIEKTESAGLVFLYDKTKLTEEDVKRGVEYWDRKLSLKRSFGWTIGSMHEKFAQICLDKMSKDLKFDWNFQRVTRGGQESFRIRTSQGNELDRVLMVSVGPLGIEHYYPIEAKYKRQGMMLPDVQKLYDVLRNSNEFGCSIEFEGKQVRVLKANVTPVLVAPYFTREAQRWALRHGMITLPTWKLTQYYAEKKGIKINLKKLSKQYLERTNKAQTIDEFLKVKLSGKV